MGICLKKVEVDKGYYKVLLCISDSKYYINVIQGGLNRETVADDIQTKEDAKERFLDIVWDIS